MPLKGHSRQADACTESDLLIAQYEAELTRYLLRKGAAGQDASEIVQEAFCRLLEHPDPDQLSNERAYLFRVAGNILIDRYRRNRVRDHYAEPADGQVFGRTETDGMEYPEMAAAFHQALNELPPRCRQVFLLGRREGLSSKEIAKRMNISPRMVQKHMVKAMQHFYMRLL